MNKAIPESIRERVAGCSYTEDTTGMSGSRVLIYEDMVLKIEKESALTARQTAMLRWIGEKLPVPKVLACENIDGVSYLLMSKIRGEMSCAEKYMLTPARAAEAAAEGLHMLWAVDIASCPEKNSISHMLSEALEYLEGRERAEWNGTYGFSSPEKQLAWLMDNRPDEDFVFAHGDYCMPNLMLMDGHVSGFIDLGQCGATDRWYDAALMLQSLERNFSGFFGTGSYPGFRREMFLDALGIPVDHEKIRYFLMLEELFM